MRCPNCNNPGFGDYIIIPNTTPYRGSDLAVIIVCQKCNWGCSEKPDPSFYGSMTPQKDNWDEYKPTDTYYDRAYTPRGISWKRRYGSPPRGE